MSLIAQEILELRQIASKLISGEIDENKVKRLIGVYNQTAKRENMLIQIAISAEKQGRKDKVWDRLDSMNLIDSKSSIDVETCGDKFKCSAQGWALITRDNCLDYSGDSKHIDFCQNCEQFAITRKQFPPTKKAK